MATAAPEIPAVTRAQAFEGIYRSYVQDVYRYALALLRNPADAEDVTQTTFMNAYRAFLRGEEPIKPQNWLIKIAHNVARTRYARASRRVKEVPLEDHVDQLAVPDGEKPDVREVLDALGALPLNQRAALVMRELEGRTYAEIADTLDVSVPAVETLIFRARRALRLKASSIRALAAVPLPSSLSQFLGGAGGIAAGGGAVLGSGFLLKAAVAIVAGVIATGVGGDHGHRNGAAAALAVPPAWGDAGEQGLTRSLAQAVLAVGGSGPRSPGPEGPVRSAHPASRNDGNPDGGSGVAATASSPGTSTNGPASKPTPPATTPATTSTSTVTDVVGTATSAVPSTPSVTVSVPGVTTTTVSVTTPPLPTLP
jgi:RNA polymerase sigma factor (sigma-70 family)